MPVRIIFRGLILFDIPTTGADAGKLVAQLINKPAVPNRPAKTIKARARGKAPRGPHEHKHGARIQVATDHGTGDVLIPANLRDKERIDISVPGARGRGVKTAPGFFDHVPRLSDVMANASIQSVRDAARAKGPDDPTLTRNVITVDRGIIRVRNIVTWDHGAFPLNGRRGPAPGRNDRGKDAASHVALKFVGSNWRGHIASEFVVDIWDANSITLGSNNRSGFSKKSATARGRVNHRVPYDTVEVLITNYEVQEHTAVPWGLDFQWLFEAVGYPAADLRADFAAFQTLARRFDRDVFDNDRRMLLESRDRSERLGSRTMGRPFPYIALPNGVESFTPLNSRSVSRARRLSSTDEEDRPICIGGFK